MASDPKTKTLFDEAVVRASEDLPNSAPSAPPDKVNIPATLGLSARGDVAPIICVVLPLPSEMIAPPLAFR